MDSCLMQLTDFILRGMSKGFHTGMILAKSILHIRSYFYKKWMDRLQEISY